MKVDFNTILYIVITIVILVVSGLGSRKKKKLQQQQISDPGGSEADSFESTEGQAGNGNFTEAQKRSMPDWQQSSSPFERLGRILQGEIPEYESMEGESLETTVDEEEQILEEIRQSRQEDQAETKPEKPEEEIIKTEKQPGKGIPELFVNVDEVKKAVIYSEILNRKYN